MMLFVILWVGIGLLYTYITWTGWQYGKVYAAAGILIPLYIWYVFDISSGVALGIFPIIAFISNMFCPHRPKTGSWREQEYKKQQEAAAKKANPALSLAEHMYMLSKGIR